MNRVVTFGRMLSDVSTYARTRHMPDAPLKLTPGQVYSRLARMGYNIFDLRDSMESVSIQDAIGSDSVE